MIISLSGFKTCSSGDEVNRGNTTIFMKSEITSVSFLVWLCCWNNSGWSYCVDSSLRPAEIQVQIPARRKQAARKRNNLQKRTSRKRMQNRNRWEVLHRFNCLHSVKKPVLLFPDKPNHCSVVVLIHTRQRNHKVEMYSFELQITLKVLYTSFPSIHWGAT